MDENKSLSAIADARGMSSLDIAEIIGKQHAHVMRDIRKLLEQGLDESNFGLKLRISDLGQGRKREDPYYNLTPKGCLILASGYNALLREKIINRLEELEKGNAQPQVPQSFSEALRLAANLQDDIEKKQRLIEDQSKAIEEKDTQIVDLSDTITKMQPKVEYLEQILSSKDVVGVNIIASDYGTTAVIFNRFLHILGIQFPSGNTWCLYKQYKSEGYTHNETFSFSHKSGSQGSRITMKWTQKGRKFLYDTLKEKGFLPMIELPANMERKDYIREFVKDHKDSLNS